MPHPVTPHADSRPEPVEDEILARVERLAGKQQIDRHWRRQRQVTARTNPVVMAWYRG